MSRGKSHVTWANVWRAVPIAIVTAMTCSTKSYRFDVSSLFFSVFILFNIIKQHLMHTLWKFILSSKGMTRLRTVDLRVVSVFLQTGTRMSAMFSFNVSAAPFATHTQYPITSNAAFLLYCLNFHANNDKLTVIHREMSQMRFQCSCMKSTALVMDRFIGCRYFFGIMVRAKLFVLFIAFSGPCAVTMPRSSVSSCQIFIH